MDEKEFLRRLDILEKKAPKIYKEIQVEFEKTVVNDITTIVTNAVSLYYKSYSPKRYIRYGSLYDAYNITIKNNTLILELGSEFMPKVHRVDEKDPDYIYQVMFKGGWHGGATSGIFYGNPHPNPGTPWWVDGVSHNWMKKAERMPAQSSPYSIIEENFNNYKKWRAAFKLSKIRQRAISKYF